LDEIPFKERRVISELVEFWQNHYEPRRLFAHIASLSSAMGSGVVASFFQQVRKDLRIDERNKYAASASEFERFLEAEYRERTKAEEREESERRAKASDDFNALGKEMAKATTRAELVELGRKRADLAPHTGISYVYENHCWQCKTHISSAIHAQCPNCSFYICSSCGSCFC